jgi:hypothetical protein
VRSFCFLLAMISLFFSARATASESIFCSGKTFSIEVLVSISTGEIFDAFIYEKTNNGASETQTNIALETKAIDYKKRTISFSGSIEDEKPASILFKSLKKKAVLNYQGKHKLACDWSAF